MDFLEKKFRLSERKTDVKTELMAGFTTFMTMSYILAVNPQMLSQTGMDKGGVFTASVIASIVAMVCMAFLANLPFGLAPGMGLNAFFTFTVVKTLGYTWQFALTAVFLEGIVFLILSLFKVREMIFDAIPINLKKAVSCGIGLFIALVGLVNSGIILQGEGTVLQLGNLLSRESVVFIVGLFIIALLLAREIKGALMYGILASTILALILGVSKYQGGSPITLPPSLAPVAFKIQFDKIFTFDMFTVVFTFLFVDIFDTVGTLVGVSAKAGMLDEQGKLKEASPALLADAIGTTMGALLGTSTVTTFVESASGVAEGGRTGLTALSTAFFFFLSLFLFPVFGMIPAQATGPALVIVGLFMLSSIKEIDFYDYSEAIPAFITIIAMPFCYSIAEGISFGMISYVLIKLLAGKRKDISILMYILAIVFVLRIIWPLF
ncbi:NCS2 family permease [Finegoldia magna]|uniref:NCS2 family permease n=1 Tax=Finegoldia magna TaxID=1260 RepID=UPI000B917768|nr:NCS2 family permease [Finegoldia magna]MCC3310677.1 NCS2 family permease [Finegoldia magna]MDU1579191.1 NCS2 family permease [Finegoldia magna]MDU1600541.1 NCS2 family permease [Finegoldia magna]OXZ32613.1 guanine permease [Finegoldia magna]PWV53145.1 AGZA family xanthine/uracil permease-like MFS transporter [Finegoldia magna]